MTDLLLDLPVVTRAGIMGGGTIGTGGFNVACSLPGASLIMSTRIAGMAYGTNPCCGCTRGCLKMGSTVARSGICCRLKGVDLIGGNMPSTSGAFVIRFGTKAITPCTCLARSKLLYSVGTRCAPSRSTLRTTEGGGRTPAGMASTSILSRRLLVTKSATGRTRITTGRVCHVHRDHVGVLANSTSGLPPSNRTVGLIVRRLRRRRGTLAGLFANVQTGRIDSCRIAVMPFSGLSGRMLFHFSPRLKVMSTSSLNKTPICVGLGTVSHTPILSPGRTRGGRGSLGNVVCGMPNGTDVRVDVGGGALCGNRTRVARFNAQRKLTPVVFRSGGTPMGICFCPRANTVGRVVRWSSGGLVLYLGSDLGICVH